MKMLYVHNYRGFSNTFIPLYEVNFLIGENSTGKTSILSLIKVLSDPQFTFSLNFQLEELDLGNFEDIVSHASNNKKNFSVGILGESDDSKRDKNYFFFITYRNQQDIPIVETYSHISDSGLIHIRIGEHSIKYKVDNEFVSENDESFQAERLVAACRVAHQEKSSGYKNLPKVIGDSFDRPPLGIVISIVDSMIAKGGDVTKKSFRMKPLRRPEDVTWIAPIREKPKRTYDQYKLGYSPEGTHTPYLLNDFLGDRRKKLFKKGLLRALEKFGIDSELFKTIRVKRYGRHKTAPFEVDVVLNEAPLKISNVGYGVAQVLPIVVECFIRPKESYFAIQQPEVHLHPKAQASLGDYVHSLASIEKKRFYIETHSDFLIDRFRRMQNTGKPVDAQVLYFERTNDGNRVYAISIEENGKYGDKQPPGFREFFLKEEMEMLSL